MDKQGQINEIWSRLLPKNQRRAAKKIAEHFEIEEEGIRFNWIYAKRTPKSKQDKALKILSKQLENQNIDQIPVIYEEI